ncbi:MAG: hypothetical protein PSV13_10215 [Lacunisphaera sp.]|nr:hypothetical protein [Lacunisphaera sp.]
MSAEHDNLIEVRLRELSQLFNMMDPSPFIDRDLTPRSSSWAGRASCRPTASWNWSSI